MEDYEEELEIALKKKIQSLTEKTSQELENKRIFWSGQPSKKWNMQKSLIPWNEFIRLYSNMS